MEIITIFLCQALNTRLQTVDERAEFTWTMRAFIKLELLLEPVYKLHQTSQLHGETFSERLNRPV